MIAAFGAGGAYHPAGKGSGMTREECCAFCQKDPKCDFAVLAGPKMKVPVRAVA